MGTASALVWRIDCEPKREEKLMATGKRTALSRRDFLKGAAASAVAVAGAGALAGCQAPAAAPNMPSKWDYEADVVVVGYGGAGAATAITAADAGARVVILEKTADGGGNTAVSLGGFLCPTNAEDAFTYITGLFDFSHSDLDKDLVRVFAEESVKNVEWFKGLREGVEVEVYGYAGYPSVPGAKSQQKYRVKLTSGSTGMGLFSVLKYAVEEKRRIPVFFETPAKRLVRNAQGEVVGLIAESKGNEIAFKAKRAVVLTCGGYEYDAKALQNFVKGYPIYAVGNPGNTGDGIRLAQQVGAGLWHMNGVSCPLGLKVKEFEAAFMISVNAPSFIWVDKHAKRFRNEKSVESHAGLLAVDFYDTSALEYPRIPCYLVFDEAARVAGPICSGLGSASKKYQWSKDNGAEVEKGWIVKGATIAELAAKLNLDPASLEATVTKWNNDVKAGQDTLFGRPINAPKEDNPAYKDQVTAVWSAPIEKPPFYAVEVHPCLLNTQGGPKRDTMARVLDAFGNPIPRLYSAGELGSMWGVIYQGAGNNAESMVFGRIAGRNAAAEKPWS